MCACNLSVPKNQTDEISTKISNTASLRSQLHKSLEFALFVQKRFKHHRLRILALSQRKTESCNAFDVLSLTSTNTLKISPPCHRVVSHVWKSQVITCMTESCHAFDVYDTLNVFVLVKDNTQNRDTQINLNKQKLGEPLDLPQPSRANPVQCYSTHQEKCGWYVDSVCTCQRQHTKCVCTADCR